MLEQKPKTTNESIESQTAVKALVELKIHNIEIPKDLEYGMWWWLRSALKDNLGVMYDDKAKGNEKYER